MGAREALNEIINDYLDWDKPLNVNWYPDIFVPHWFPKNHSTKEERDQGVNCFFYTVTGDLFEFYTIDEEGPDVVSISFDVADGENVTLRKKVHRSSIMSMGDSIDR